MKLETFFSANLAKMWAVSSNRRQVYLLVPGGGIRRFHEGIGVVRFSHPSIQNLQVVDHCRLEQHVPFGIVALILLPPDLSTCEVSELVLGGESLSI